MSERGRSAVKSLWIFTLVVAACAGCSASISTSVERAAPNPDDVRVDVADRAAYDKIVGNLRGSVVLVDFWAHWCEPCVKNFPHVIELANRHWAKGLAVVTVDTDAPEAIEKTAAFFKEQRAGAAVNLVSKLGGSSTAMDAFEIPNGSLPCYKLYDRKGQLRHTYAFNPAAEQQFTLQEIDAAIEQLLAE